MQDDTLALHYLITHAIPDAVAAVVAPLAVLIYLFVVDWRLALALLVPVLFSLVLMSVMSIQSGPKIGQSQKWSERMTGEAGAYLEGQPVVRVFGGAAASTFRRRLEEYIDFLVDWQRPFVGKKTLMDLVTRPSAFLWLIMAVGTPLVVAGRMDPVNLLPFLFLGTTFGARLLGIAYGLGGIRGHARRPAHPERARRERTHPAHRGFRRDRRARGHRVLRSRDLRLPARRRGARGHQPAVAPRHGDGPGRPVRLRQIHPGRPAGPLPRRGPGRHPHRRQGYPHPRGRRPVPAGGFRPAGDAAGGGTVADNIALARPDAGAAQIEAAARAAQIHERIMALPQGYDTVLQAGSGLSGGERQRLTIARAILADTPVLILDEATAFADPESEFLVQQALNRLTRDRTVLVIAHRLHTITGADQIVVLDHGRIAEIGTHDQLYAAEGRYRALWDSGRGVTAVEEARR